MRIRHCLMGAAAVLAVATASAHHGWSSYDVSKTLKIQAPLLDVQYRNPHVEAAVDYQGARWHVVLAPVSRMESRGLPMDALSAGKVVSIEGYPRSDGTHELRAERITVDDKTVELR
ncbi:MULTISPECIES: DUF6152 family protein [unclassified Caballeronia]|uniref:DUF6152 family protein n=1 Tax=unclassified Caballeronia TaxID=2646786 RepID=UPI00285898C9|nr:MULTISPECIES: DUF6152 family protein [unclassified Caballeronia]MDR5740504.1 DUF6152 family protein [Caballeronia sp. LZ016]MDR5808976.1 DUF6152 family protein [Caballeronia sp. LZ019]